MSRPRCVRTSLLAGSLTLVLAVAAAAANSSLSLKGPSSVRLGTKFTYTVSGHAASPADFVAAFEPPGATPCASTYDHEFSFGGSGLGERIKTNHDFSFKLHFKARTKGKHTLCVYLIDFKHTHTYATASAQWTDHS